MNKLPYMQWYRADHRAATNHLSYAEDGAYRRLLDAAWDRDGTLPDNDQQLSRIVGCDSLAEWRGLRKILEPFFKISHGLWRQKRLSSELQKASNTSDALSVAGRKGSDKRWGNKKKLKNGRATSKATNQATSHANALPNGNPNGISESDTDSEARFARLEADASPVFSPLRSEKTSPRAAKLDFWKRADSLVGDRSLIARMAKQFGRQKVDHALDAIERVKPEQPCAYLVACCQERLNGADEPEPSWKFEPPKEPPPPRLYPEEA